MAKKKQPKIDIWLAKDGWRWKFLAGNGDEIAASTEGYATKWSANRSKKKFVKDITVISEN